MLSTIRSKSPDFGFQQMSEKLCGKPGGYFNNHRQNQAPERFAHFAVHIDLESMYGGNSWVDGLGEPEGKRQSQPEPQPI
jgi:hypothetical protein